MAELKGARRPGNRLIEKGKVGKAGHDLALQRRDRRVDAFDPTVAPDRVDPFKVVHVVDAGLGDIGDCDPIPKDGPVEVTEPLVIQGGQRPGDRRGDDGLALGDQLHGCLKKPGPLHFPRQFVDDRARIHAEARDFGHLGFNRNRRKGPAAGSERMIVRAPGKRRA